MRSGDAGVPALGQAGCLAARRCGSALVPTSELADPGQELTYHAERRLAPSKIKNMHFEHGQHPIAFVFSAPGAKEKLSGRPVTGDTGTNLEEALEYLAQARPDVFFSRARYDYRITNAFSQPLAKSLGDPRTEATRREILLPANVLRVQQELKGVQLVMLCGAKAGYLYDVLHESGFEVIRCSHTSNRGLVSKHNAAAKGGATPEERRALRVQAWAKCFLKQLPARHDA